MLGFQANIIDLGCLSDIILSELHITILIYDSREKLTHLLIDAVVEICKQWMIDRYDSFIDVCEVNIPLRYYETISSHI